MQYGFGTLLLIAAPISAAVFNHDFETPEMPFRTFNRLSEGSTALTGWEVVKGDIDHSFGFSSGDASPLRGQFVELNGSMAGAIQQEVTLAPGLYRVNFSFDVSSSGPARFLKMGGFWDGVEEFSLQTTVPDDYSGFSENHQFGNTGFIVEGGGTHLLRFESFNPSRAGFFIDNVSITPVPEPHEYALLFGAGLLMVGVSRRMLGRRFQNV